MHIAIAIVIGVIFGVVLPEGNGITQEGLTVLAIFVPTLYLWMAIAPTTWVSILFLAAFAMTGIRTPAQLWQQSVGHFTFMLVLAFMMFDNCLRETGATKYLSNWFITRKFTQGKPYLFLTMFFASNLVIGFFVQNVALAIVFVTLTANLLGSIGLKKGDRLYTLMFVGIVWGNAVNHIASPIGKSIPNIIIGLVNGNTDATITWAQWITVGVPFLVAMLIVTMIAAKIYLRKEDVELLKKFDVVAYKKEKLEPLVTRGKIALIALLAIFVVIMVPDILNGFGMGNVVTLFITRMTITVWALVMVVLLCLIRIREKASGEVKPVLNFSEAMKDVDVGILLFITVVIFIGGPLGASSAGIVDWMGNIFSPIVQAIPLVAIFALLGLLALILTQLMASTVVATIMFWMGVAVFAVGGVFNADGEFIRYLIAGEVLAEGEVQRFITSSTSLPWVMIGSFAACIGIFIPASTATTALYYGPHIQVSETWKTNIIFLLLTLVAVVAMIPIALAVFG